MQPLTETPAPPASPAPLPGVRSRRLELAAGLLVAAISVLLIALEGRDLWFFSDVWERLTGRRILSFHDLMRHHGGHWVVPQTFIVQGLYAVFGTAYWPYFIFLRLAYAGICFAVWRVWRSQGLDPLPAFGAYVVLLFLAPAAWLTNIAHVGIVIIFGCLLGAAVLVERVAQPSNRQKGVLFGLLTLAMATGGAGTGVWAGVGGALVLARRVRAWWPALVGSAAIYLVWYLTYGRLQRPGELKPAIPALQTLLDAPVHATALFSKGLASFVMLPEVLSTLLLGGLVAWLLALAVRRRLRVFDACFLLAALGFVGLVVLVRAPVGLATGIFAPFKIFASILIILPPVLFHLLRGVRYRWKPVIFMGLLLLAGINASVLLETVNQRERGRRLTRPRVEATAWMLGRGEPYIPFGRIDPQLNGRTVQWLVDRGFEVEEPPEEALAVEIRGILRMHENDRRVRGTPLKVAAPVAEGCTSVAPGATLIGTVEKAGAIGLEGVAGSTLALEWSDAFGRGQREIEIPAGQNQRFIGLAQPAERATLTLSGTWTAPITVCGVTR